MSDTTPSPPPAIPDEHLIGVIEKPRASAALWKGACADCTAYWQANATALRGACASVGIEHALSTFEAVWLFFVRFHEKGHADG